MPVDWESEAPEIAERRRPPGTPAAGPTPRRRCVKIASLRPGPAGVPPTGAVGRRRMALGRLLIANRGEIAIRIARAAADLGVATVGVHAEDDAGCLHLRRVDAVRALRGRGAHAYLGAEQIV